MKRSRTYLAKGRVRVFSFVQWCFHRKYTLPNLVELLFWMPFFYTKTIMKSNSIKERKKVALKKLSFFFCYTKKDVCCKNLKKNVKVWKLFFFFLMGYLLHPRLQKRKKIFFFHQNLIRKLYLLHIIQGTIVTISIYKILTIEATKSLA